MVVLRTVARKVLWATKNDSSVALLRKLPPPPKKASIPLLCNIFRNEFYQFAKYSKIYFADQRNSRCPHFCSSLTVWSTQSEPCWCVLSLPICRYLRSVMLQQHLSLVTTIATTFSPESCRQIPSRPRRWWTLSKPWDGTMFLLWHQRGTMERVV